ncbi:MAG: SHOCT domain-containing protein [Pseudonocardia sp.]
MTAAVGSGLLIAVAPGLLGGGGSVLALGGISRGDRSAVPAHGQARRILDERYARGELTTEEYRERLRTQEEPR